MPDAGRDLSDGGKRRGADGHQHAEALSGADGPSSGPPGGGRHQPEDATDGESASQSSSRAAKWAYCEEFRPQWAWDEKRGRWAKRHPCRCHRGPRYCQGFAVKYDLFLCKSCHVRTAQGEVLDQCTCTCDGCGEPPVGSADRPRPNADAPVPMAGQEGETEDHAPAPPVPHPAQHDRLTLCTGVPVFSL